MIKDRNKSATGYRPPGTTVGTLEDILGSRAKIRYPHRVNFNNGITNGNLDDMRKWCKANCKGIWHSHVTWACYFQFTDEQDALMFTLRWGTGSA